MNIVEGEKTYEHQLLVSSDDASAVIEIVRTNKELAVDADSTPLPALDEIADQWLPDQPNRFVSTTTVLKNLSEISTTYFFSSEDEIDDIADIESVCLPWTQPSPPEVLERYQQIYRTAAIANHLAVLVDTSINRNRALAK